MTGTGLWASLGGAGIIGIFLTKMLDKLFGKKRESLEISKLYKEGTNLNIQIRTNIDKLIADKTASLTTEVQDLKSTIVELSVKNTKESNAYIKRMAELEEKLDFQIDRSDRIEEKNETLQIKLEEEVKVRTECLTQLSSIRERVKELEKYSASPNN